MELHVSLVGRTDLSGQIYRQIRAAILAEQLRPGETLPSSRELAARLDVSRNTVGAAFDHLTAEGFLTSRAGVGTYVSQRITQEEPPPADARQAPLTPRPIWHEQPEPIDMSLTAPEYDFRPGTPDASLFPYPTWRALVADQLRPSAVGAGVYVDPAGHRGLREAISRHIAVSRSVLAGPEQILVTSGTQQALDLVGRVLIEPSDVVVMEDPGYPSARAAFASLGARVVGVPVDEAGLDPSRLPPQARLAFVSPSHQFPLGASMSLPRRMALLDWADRTGAVIVEDDYDSEFRYVGRPIEPLQSLDRAGRVVYLGTFSKTMLPTLRLGFYAAPAALVPALRKAKYVLDWHTALPMQAALAEFIGGGRFARHLRRMRNHYRARRDRILLTLERDFAGLLVPISGVAGLHLAAWLPGATTQRSREIARAARARGVFVQALCDFAVSAPPRPGLIIGYGMIPVDRIDEGLLRLRDCVTRS